jgi:hypothetical protein
MQKKENMVLDWENDTRTPKKRRVITPRIAALIAQTASRYDIGVNVYPKGEKWNVSIAGKDRAKGTFSTQEEAVKTAEKLIEPVNKAYIVIHNKMWKISKIITK